MVQKPRGIFSAFTSIDRGHLSKEKPPTNIKDHNSSQKHTCAAQPEPKVLVILKKKISNRIGQSISPYHTHGHEEAATHPKFLKRQNATPDTLP